RAPRQPPGRLLKSKPAERSLAGRGGRRSTTGQKSRRRCCPGGTQSSGRSGVHTFAEKDTVEPVLVGPVGLGVPVPQVVGQVLGHRRVGVEAYLRHVQGTGSVF